MPAALLVLLLVQSADPRLEPVERLVGSARRPYLWAPLKVTVKSDAGFDGDLEVASSLGIRVVQRVHVPAHGSISVRIPAIDPQKVTAGATTVTVAAAARTPDRVVLVDSRLPYASELTSDDRVLVQTVGLEDLTWLLSQGLLDGCDLLLLKEAAGLSLGGVRAWAIAPSKEDAEKAMAAPAHAGEPVLLVDPDLWALAPEGGWVPAKRDWTLIFAALYALVAFAALVFAARKGKRATTAAGAAVAAFGVAAFLGFFPTKHLWVVERSCEVVSAGGDAQELRLWFAGAAAPLRPILEFPRVVKPVFPRLGDAEEPLTLRIGEGGGCRAEGFTLQAGRSLCFSAMGGRAPSMRVQQRVEKPLYRAYVRRAGKVSRVGDLAAGGEVPAGGSETSPGEDAEVRVWLRFAEGDALVGRLERSGGPATGVGSPDLADGRRAAALYLRRLP